MALLKEVVQVKQILMEREFPYADSIRSTSQAAELAMKEIGESTQERVLLLVLNTKNEINAIHQVFVGTLSVSVAHPRDIFQSALMNNGARIMLFHNHPSGKLEPSEADFKFTEQISEIGEIIGIPLLDHIIVTEKEFYSFREEGHLL